MTTAAIVGSECNEGGSVLTPVGLKLPAPFVGDEITFVSCLLLLSQYYIKKTSFYQAFKNNDKDKPWHRNIHWTEHFLDCLRIYFPAERVT